MPSTKMCIFAHKSETIHMRDCVFFPTQPAGIPLSALAFMHCINLGAFVLVLQALLHFSANNCNGGGKNGTTNARGNAERHQNNAYVSAMRTYRWVYHHKCVRVCVCVCVCGMHQKNVRADAMAQVKCKFLHSHISQLIPVCLRALK